MTNVQNIVENVGIGNAAMTTVADYGGEIHADLEGDLSLEDVTFHIGRALARIGGVLGPDALTVNHEDALRAGGEAKDAELAYLAAGVNESSDPDARSTSALSHQAEEAATAAAAELLAMKTSAETALAGLQAAKEALAAYEARRLQLLTATQEGLVAVPQAAVTAGEAYIARLGGGVDPGAPSAT
ncbi:MAG TPA: hypothetical protein VLH86_03150 [Patescibacteria group bacterium]|nr:hypothetical protein [Patescibacteria group bacterium]